MARRVGSRDAAARCAFSQQASKLVDIKLARRESSRVSCECEERAEKWQQEPGLAHPLTQHFLRHNPPANRQEPSPFEKTSAGNCTALSPQDQSPLLLEALNQRCL
ncbi:hypothetical protein CGGC5_v011134 [Colletotrichum fructicola Nara gc5]|uniref:Uncharacterized protein n=1 Tax=Colletotrichum fructicola (strain Nara gc5) TaxID=1213859 RepID=A0A7J6IX38_COLFN|nr:hypothetical protein CGGC5_v011134 [Colletotrichum fructicola Nara gc5]